MKTLMTSAALLMAASGAIAETYALDPTHTEVRFYWNHAGLTEQHGEWLGIAGTIEFDAENVTATSADITIDSASIHTGVVALDDELKGESSTQKPTLRSASPLRPRYRQVLKPCV